MNYKPLSLAFGSFIVLAANAAPVSARQPAGEELGLCGLRRVELVFVNRGGEAARGLVGGVVVSGAVAPAVPPAEDLADRVLANEQECRTIGATIAGFGLEVVDRCRPEDTACAKLYLTAETGAIPASGDRTFLVEVALSQPVQLKRDVKVELSQPTTWSEHRLGVIDARHSATVSACTNLRDLATWFVSMWVVANK